MNKITRNIIAIPLLIILAIITIPFVILKLIRERLSLICANLIYWDDNPPKKETYYKPPTQLKQTERTKEEKDEHERQVAWIEYLATLTYRHKS
jgi:hypothetical protein